MIGVEKETGFTLNYDKYNWENHPEHFILQDCTKDVDFGEGKKTCLHAKIQRFWFSVTKKSDGSA